MEATPGGAGISVLNTGLEVDLAPPVGYAGPPSIMTSNSRLKSIHRQQGRLGRRRHLQADSSQDFRCQKGR